MTDNDQTTSVATLRDEVRAFIEARDWDQFHSPKDLAIGLITEASEFLEHFRFRDEAEIVERLEDTNFRQELAHELADCFYFVLALSNKLDFDLTDVLRSKLIISGKRYPPERASGRNEKYTEL